MSKRFLVLIALLMLGFFVAGCADGDKSSSVVNPNPDQFSPVGSISGVVYDACTNVPVKGAVVSVAYAGRVHQVTTSSNGAYSFNNVPAQAWGYMYGDDGYGGYTVSCDLTKVTGYGYALVDDVYVYYSDLEDGYNYDLLDGAEDDYGYGGSNSVTEAGSGASTPVNNLAANLDFTPGPLTSGISGTIYDVSTGRAVSGATVSLFYGSKYLTSVTSTDGTYSFANILPYSGYNLMVTKAGYQYAALQAANTVTVPASCGMVDVACSIGCGQVKAGINVNMIANPAKDKTVPYIVSVAAGGESDIIRYDSFPSMELADVTNIVFTFSEAMQASRTLKGNAVELYSTFVVTATSTGPLPTGATPVTMDQTLDIIESYTVTMTSAGIMTITPTYKTATDFIADGGWTGMGTTPTFTISTVGDFSVHFDAYTGSPHLTDASFNPWSIGPKLDTPTAPGSVDDYGYLHAFGEAYQDYFIFDGGHHFEFTIGE